MKQIFKIVVHILLTGLCVSAFAANQQKLVSGIVRDTKGIPLAGVTVFVKDTGNGVTTDHNGQYMISADKGDILVFSILGYKEYETLIADKDRIDVELLDNYEEIEAASIVEIGYGVMNKKDLSGSVSVVNITDALKAPVTSFDQAMQGRIAGVNISSSDGQPGVGYDIVIRGANSLTQDNSPLFVVDGFPMEDYAMSAINPSDIASIAILKDASATAIYGSRGANGVIVIETKQGMEGKPKVSYNGTFGVQQVTKKIEMMNPYEFVSYMIELDPDDNYDRYITRPGKTLDDYKNVEFIDWQDRIFRLAPINMHDVSLRGGTKQTKYSVSGAYVNQNGVIDNTGYEKYQGRASLSQQIGNRFKVDLTAGMTEDITKGQGVSSLLSDTNSHMSTLMYRAWGYRPFVLDGMTEDDLFDETEDGLSVGVMNPKVSNKNEQKYKKKTAFTSTLKIEYSIIDGLKLVLRGGYNKKITRNEEFNNQYTYKGYPSSSNSLKTNASFSELMKSDLMNENTLTYIKTIRKKHKINAVAGFTLQSTKYSTYGFKTSLIPLEGLGISGMDEGTPYETTSLISENRLMSGLARMNYSYDSRYYLTASFRADGSSKFRKGNRWGYFPSAAIAWRISEEDFMKNAKAVNEAKIRFSYGVTGNNRVGDFDSYASLIMNDYYSFGNETPQGAIASWEMGNADLKWERTHQMNLGMDLSLFDKRLNLVFDMYRKTTKDLLLDADVPYSSGFVTIFKNVGSVRNDGLELTVNTVNINTSDFTWTTDFNISFNRSKVLALSEGQEALLSKIKFTAAFNNTYLYMAKVGGPIAAFYGFEYDGLYRYEDFDVTSDGKYVLKPSVPGNGSTRSTIQPGDIKYVDQDGDGTITDYDRIVIGRCLPIHVGGFNNNFTYKNFSLSVFFQWSYGNDVFNANRIMFEGNYANRNINQYRSYVDHWTPDNPESENYRPGGQGPAGLYSSRTIEDGSFIRLKTLQFSYTLPHHLTQKIRADLIKVFLSGQNLYTWTRYSGLDPEVSTRNTALTPGFDYSSYARNRVYTIGLNVTF